MLQPPHSDIQILGTGQSGKCWCGVWSTRGKGSPLESAGRQFVPGRPENLAQPSRHRMNLDEIARALRCGQRSHSLHGWVAGSIAARSGQRSIDRTVRG